jgi:hypothetical protein
MFTSWEVMLLHMHPSSSCYPLSTLNPRPHREVGPQPAQVPPLAVKTSHGMFELLSLPSPSTPSPT